MWQTDIFDFKNCSVCNIYCNHYIFFVKKESGYTYTYTQTQSRQNKKHQKFKAKSKHKQRHNLLNQPNLLSSSEIGLTIMLNPRETYYGNAVTNNFVGFKVLGIFLIILFVKNFCMQWLIIYVIT